jgi:imidazolonepropionase-like amidohydrolase
LGKNDGLTRSRSGVGEEGCQGRRRLHPNPRIGAQEGLERKFEHMVTAYQSMRKRGIRVVIGGDYGFTVTPMGQNARDIGQFVKFLGYTPAEALRCATAIGGQLMGYGGALGVIRKGAFADLLLVGVNPLDDVSCLVGPSHFE